eukprot:3900979-Rhodomonas_salina.1
MLLLLVLEILTTSTPATTKFSKRRRTTRTTEFESSLGRNEETTELGGSMPQGLSATRCEVDESSEDH